uniref:STI1 domain-containing protein n=2 Tax=Hemiselmis andersenii TaxID=464988 RepID=A0A7S0TUP4_HEMAN|mmetsp:Transcript_24627/g.56932  ORF Transcript_24627/g.56932 Transcript_24627/m.56932 type:complete len:156 (+) Transcript_24627:33-500(+)
MRTSRALLLFALGLLAVTVSAKDAKTCSTGVEEEADGASLDGAHNARLGFQFMKEAQKNPEMMADVMKDMQDPETMAEVQKMMEDPSFQAEVARYKEMMMKDPKVRAQLESMKNNPEMLQQMGEKMMAQMGAGGMGGMGGMGAGKAGGFGGRRMA